MGDKHYLYPLSLVCRYWAGAVRRSIFQEFNLRSREDALQFIALAKCDIWPSHSILPIGKYVDTLLFHVDFRGLSWIHLILRCMPSDILGLTSDFPIDVWLIFRSPSLEEKEDKAQLPAPRDIYHDLPRRIPPTMGKFNLLDIAVNDLCFRRFDHLLSFLGSAGRRVPELLCKSVKFMDVDTPRNGNPNRSILRMVAPLQNLNIEQCSDTPKLLELMLTLRVCARVHPPPNYAEVQRNIASVINGISTFIKSFCGKSHNTDDEDHESKTYPIEAFFNDSERDSNISYVEKILGGPKLPDETRLLFTCHLRSEDDEAKNYGLTIGLSREGHLLGMWLYRTSGSMRNLVKPPTLNTVDFGAIDALTSQPTQHPEPWCLNVQADTSDVSDMEEFASTLKLKMPLMQSAGRLVIEWGRRGEDRWIREVRDDEGASEREDGDGRGPGAGEASSNHGSGDGRGQELVIQQDNEHGQSSSVGGEASNMENSDDQGPGVGEAETGGMDFSD